MITEQELREGLDRQVEAHKEVVLSKIPKNRGHALINDEQFYKGKPCKYGHIGIRHVSDSGCYHCNKERKLKRKTI